MKRKTTFFVLLVVFFAGIVNAQTPADGFSKLNQKDYPAAKKIFAALLKADPKNATALYGMGEYYYNTGKTDSARISYQNGIASSSSNAYNYAGLGKVNFLSNPVLAEANFKDAVKKSKKDAGAIIAISRFYYGLTPKNLAEAKRYINLAIGVDPNSGSAYFLNGLIEYDKSNISDAALQFDRAIHFDSNQLEAYLYASKIMASTRNFQQAVEYINSAIAVNPKYWLAYKSLGELYYDKQKYADAVTNFEIYFKNVPGDKDVTHYAYSLFFNKQYKEARALIDKLISQNPNDYVPLRLLGYISYEEKDLVNGKAIMDKFFKLVPPDKILTDDYSYYGKMLSAAGNDSLAIVNYKLALKKDSSQYQVFDELSKSYKRLKKFDQYLYYGSEYVKKKPTLTVVDYYNLGNAYLSSAYSIIIKPDTLSLNAKTKAKIDKTKIDSLRLITKNDSLKQLKYFLAADSLYAKVETYSPDSYLGPLMRGRTNAAIDKESTLGLAKPFYEKALVTLVKDTAKYKKEVSEIYNYLGFYYYLKEDNAASIEYWKKLLELDPANTKAQEAIKSLEKKK